MTNTEMPEPIRFLLTRSRGSSRFDLWVHRQTFTPGKGLKLRRVQLGSFHTTNGARAFARIHAGSQPYRLAYDVAASI